MFVALRFDGFNKPNAKGEIRTPKKRAVIMEKETAEQMKERILDMVRLMAFARRKNESALSGTAWDASFLVEEYDRLFAPEKASKYLW
jgi:hypothetical protein